MRALKKETAEVACGYTHVCAVADTQRQFSTASAPGLCSSGLRRLAVGF